MKSDLLDTERYLKLSKEAMELASSVSRVKSDSKTKKDMNNLMDSFLSGNNELSEDVAKKALYNLEQRLKDMDNADNTK